MTVGNACEQAFALAATPAQARHLGVQTGFIDEDQARRIEIGLAGEPHLPRSPHIGALLLSRVARLFFTVIARRSKNRHSVP